MEETPGTGSPATGRLAPGLDMRCGSWAGSLRASAPALLSSATGALNPPGSPQRRPQPQESSSSDPKSNETMPVVTDCFVAYRTVLQYRYSWWRAWDDGPLGPNALRITATASPKIGFEKSPVLAPLAGTGGTADAAWVFERHSGAHLS